MSIELSPSPLGIIEGFYGDPWSWETSRAYCPLLKQMGYEFFIYAPKADAYLRKKWAEPWPDSEFEELKSLAAAARASGIAFGIGFSPFELPQNYTEDNKRKLLFKVGLIMKELRPEIFCLLFDDMKGDFTELAKKQVEIADDVAAQCSSARLVLCPSYYSTDPLLEKLFGVMPTGYLEALGSAVDRRIDMFWTGPRICSTEYPRQHLEWVTGLLKRKPFIWDNYPVNDDRKMAAFIHLRAFENRTGELSELAAGHAINPMRQPWLSLIPLATLPLNYKGGPEYDARAAFRLAAAQHCKPDMARMLEEDLPAFQDVGLDALSPQDQERLRARYEACAEDRHAKEVLAWLNGRYRFSESWYD